MYSSLTNIATSNAVIDDATN